MSSLPRADQPRLHPGVRSKPTTYSDSTSTASSEPGPSLSSTLHADQFALGRSKSSALKAVQSYLAEQQRKFQPKKLATEPWSELQDEEDESPAPPAVSARPASMFRGLFGVLSYPYLPPPRSEPIELLTPAKRRDRDNEEKGLLIEVEDLVTRFLTLAKDGSSLPVQELHSLVNKVSNHLLALTDEDVADLNLLDLLKHKLHAMRTWMLLGPQSGGIFKPFKILSVCVVYDYSNPNASLIPGDAPRRAENVTVMVRVLCLSWHDPEASLCFVARDICRLVQITHKDEVARTVQGLGEVRSLQVECMRKPRAARTLYVLSAMSARLLIKQKAKPLPKPDSFNVLAWFDEQVMLLHGAFTSSLRDRPFRRTNFGRSDSRTQPPSASNSVSAQSNNTSSGGRNNLRVNSSGLKPQGDTISPMLVEAALNSLPVDEEMIDDVVSDDDDLVEKQMEITKPRSRKPRWKLPSGELQSKPKTGGESPSDIEPISLASASEPPSDREQDEAIPAVKRKKTSKNTSLEAPVPSPSSKRHQPVKYAYFEQVSQAGKGARKKIQSFKLR